MFVSNNAPTVLKCAVIVLLKAQGPQVGKPLSLNTKAQRCQLAISTNFSIAHGHYCTLVSTKQYCLACVWTTCPQTLCSTNPNNLHGKSNASIIIPTCHMQQNKPVSKSSSNVHQKHVKNTVQEHEPGYLLRPTARTSFKAK